jgi:hypothetical protein
MLGRSLLSMGHYPSFHNKFASPLQRLTLVTPPLQRLLLDESEETPPLQRLLLDESVKKPLLQRVLPDEETSPPPRMLQLGCFFTQVS